MSCQGAPEATRAVRPTTLPALSRLRPGVER